MSARADKAPRLTVRVLHASAPFAAIAVLVIAWALIKIVFDLQDFVLPSPWRVLLAFLDAPGPFLVGSFETALSATFGFLIAVIVGVSLASALSLSRLVERSVYPLTLLFQMVPLIAIAPLLVLWFGYGRPTIVASAAIVSVFPIIANTLTGLRSRDERHLELFTILGAKHLTVWWKLSLPSAVPSIVTGLRIAAGLAVIGTIAGEFIAGVGGDRAPLGIMITTALRNFQTDRVFVSELLSACVGFTVFGAVSLTSRVVLARWMRV